MTTPKQKMGRPVRTGGEPRSISLARRQRFVSADQGRSGGVSQGSADPDVLRLDWRLLLSVKPITDRENTRYMDIPSGCKLVFTS
ncbi:MAG: hypothetical protein ACN6QH_25925 [Pseudomonas sp.]|uniref:hypothetical protein n=1 Tax=Pseudomonas sp. TaxID=306 RepID=UPI003D0D1A61